MMSLPVRSVIDCPLWYLTLWVTLPSIQNISSDSDPQLSLPCSQSYFLHCCFLNLNAHETHGDLVTMCSLMSKYRMGPVILMMLLVQEPHFGKQDFTKNDPSLVFFLLDLRFFLHLSDSCQSPCILLPGLL